MKKIRFYIIGLLVSFLTISVSTAQNYKQQFPSIDATGKVMDEKGHHIGWVTHDGIIKDSTGVKIAHVDAAGNLVDPKTGKKLGKAEKNGSFIYHQKAGEETWTVSAPMNGTCEVKDKSGKTVVQVHENYKQYGACAYHCLQMKKEHKDMKMK